MCTLQFQGCHVDSLHVTLFQMEAEYKLVVVTLHLSVNKSVRACQTPRYSLSSIALGEIEIEH